ncbi:hypothetical protein SLEP1_g25274 [Rubroshorea leprosula]|uniref:FBD domain-containing protein n=1 Tax=Rubroshorea leprosula TaxID=152421 RepID=A0AAV5JI61_9ROSI|nr:hypothetical protein SLEP1_g25274 [Rubroshorea leprosula]
MAKVMKFESSVDRISALPDEVLIHILSLLPTKIAVLTSVLSSRWRYLFTSISRLEFNTNVKNDAKKAKLFMNFIDRVLFFRHRDRPSIVKFCLSWDAFIDPLRIDGWLRALMFHNIQELYLYNIDDQFEALPFPASLFSCETLEILKFNLSWASHDLQVPARICLPKLKVLEIEGIGFPDDGSVKRLFSSCPVLEDLVLYGCRFRDHYSKFIISNPSLKRLTLYFMNTDRPDQIVQIIVNAPSLVYLDYCFTKDYSLVLADVSSLAKAVIKSKSLYPEDFVPVAPDVFRGIKNIQSLEITNYILYDLWHQKIPLPWLENMNDLKICQWDIDLGSDCLEYLLTHCVVLKKLVLEEYSPTKGTGINYSLKRSSLSPLLSHLKTIEIQSFRMEAESHMETIKFFLNNATILEELTICIKQILPEQQLKIMKELLTLQRASNKCQVIIDIKN